MILQVRDDRIEFPRRPLVMGIVNLNDDSFCGDGTLDVAAALAQAETMIAEGADVIDIGAESARTNRGPIPVGEEVARLVPFVERWGGTGKEGIRDKRKEKRDEGKGERPEGNGPEDEAPCVPRPLLSLNTWRSEVVERVLPLGGDILNDISALPDARNAALCAEHGAALVIMHGVGAPKVAHTHVRYDDVMGALEAFFAEKIALARSAGLREEQIVLDPGIDFAKQRDDNLRIYRELGRLHRFGRPLLLPVSRKTVIGDVLGLENPLERDAGTVACIAAGVRRGAHIFRVHNVAAAAQAVKVLWGVQGSE